MSVLARLEGWLERSIEGLFGRRSGGVQPLDVGRKLARLMEEQKQVSVSEVYAPNSFLVHLAPPDYARLASISPRLSEELEQHLARVAHRQGYALVGPLAVEWSEVPDLPPGTFRVEASFTPAADGRDQGKEGGLPPDATTLVFRRPSHREAPSPAQPGPARAAGAAVAGPPAG
ncbi:MAG: DUF3662 domain-containing protein, partial [Bacillota bacterium]|nr:DUF3662 domain-containing protein [Bacillota bacterium]